MAAQRLGLAAFEGGGIEARDQLLEQTVPVDLGLESEKNPGFRA
jgi:hypothetical protein